MPLHQWSKASHNLSATPIYPCSRASGRKFFCSSLLRPELWTAQASLCWANNITITAEQGSGFPDMRGFRRCLAFFRFICGYILCYWTPWNMNPVLWWKHLRPVAHSELPLVTKQGFITSTIGQKGYFSLTFIDRLLIDHQAIFRYEDKLTTLIFCQCN